MTSGSATSWGNLPRAESISIPLHWRCRPLPASPDPLLPHGLGRSYGDSCLNDGGATLHTRGLDRLIAFDPETGRLECEAGVSLDELLAFATPRGWFLPVTPGTRFVTVGGAIANDVHGKNHHRAGTFASCVESFELLRSDGERRVCGRTRHARWFRATVGGLGLTGLVTRATLRLRRIVSPHLDVEHIRMRNLDDFFRLSDQSRDTHEYTVAWVDGLATGAETGRGVFIRANHAAEPEALTWKPPRSLPVPFPAPNALLNRAAVRAFNTLYRRRVREGIHRRREHFLPFFYPLDAVGHWNRLYGRRGLYQHQSVLPREAVGELLDAVGRGGQASFLAVLKVFGDAPPEGLLGFPRPGVTLAMDFPNRGADTQRLMERLDEIVFRNGGALYPAKDARMSPASFRASFPALDVFTPYVDPAFSSSFWRRVTEIPL